MSSANVAQRALLVSLLLAGASFLPAGALADSCDLPARAMSPAQIAALARDGCPVPPVAGGISAGPRAHPARAGFPRPRAPPVHRVWRALLAHKAFRGRRA